MGDLQSCQTEVQEQESPTREKSERDSKSKANSKLEPFQAGEVSIIIHWTSIHLDSLYKMNQQVDLDQLHPLFFLMVHTMAKIRYVPFNEHLHSF